ncbi:MAG: PaaI family thioesterase [Pseudomonadota bacterium]
MQREFPKTPEEWAERGSEHLPGHLGIVFDKVETKEVVGRFTVRQHLMAWNGFLHAGSVVTLADTCAGYGTIRSLPDGASGFTTINLTSSFLGTAREGDVVCVATPIHQGRTTQVWDAVVRSVESDKRMAHFRCTQMILWPR